jgi:hypothetical protein
MPHVVDLPEYVGEFPNFCGSEELLRKGARRADPAYSPYTAIHFAQINSCFANALHMHQPMIPAGGDDLRTARVISNLQAMMEHPGIGDNHNAPVFHLCYKRMGEIIPRLVEEGKLPRIMLEYSGCLLHGLRQMGLDDVFENLERITCDWAYRHCVEWLGAPWGHAVAPSTPVQDYRLHVLAWRHHFAAIFGLEALDRVRGFSPSEMALPNHPDVSYEFVKTLKECGYDWVLVQEHTVEQAGSGAPLSDRHIPHRLVVKNSKGETAQITAIIKTQGSDTKLVAQMQPCYEARGLSRQVLAGRSIPPLVTQIADGENGGVMMNEFPPKYVQVMRESSGSSTPAVNVTEYLEYLKSLGIREDDFPAIQPLMQHRIWKRFPEAAGPEMLARVIEELRSEDRCFHMDGGSWTNNISWVQGYESVLGPMEKVSSLFSEMVLKPRVPANDHRYRNALYHLLMSQTSCYRYWGDGIWTEYGRELCRRTSEILRHDF